jgi:hypothetical protein
MNTLNELFRAEGMPVFQNRMYPTAEEAKSCVTGNIVLVQNLRTGLIYNREFDPSLVVYDCDYQNEQANSAAFRKHLDDVVSLIQTHLSGKSLIEVGCGKGGFLEQLSSLGFSITGMDPAYEGGNPAIRAEFFTADSEAHAGGVILRHVLEHIPDPVSFLAGIRDANGGGGLIYIEVPCFDWILANHSWFDVFYEHVNYFRLTDFQRMFGRVVAARHSFGGQYLSILADLSSLREPLIEEAPIVFPENFTAGARLHADRLKESSASPSVIWGGASKGVVFAIHMNRHGAPVEAMVDINPAKQGKFVAVTGMRVESPEEILDRLPNGIDIIVMNPNYLQEIREQTGDRHHYRTTDIP